MSDAVVAHIHLKRETGFHYFIAGEGDVVKMDRKTKEKTVIHSHAFTPERGFFYFLNNEGNVAKTVRVPRKKKEVVPPPPAEPVPAPVA
jgi:hypothetical protein